MPNNNWDNQKIEELLKQAPTIQDHRPKSEVLAKLKQDERFRKLNRKKVASKWIPAFVAVAALLLLSVLLPSMLRGNEAKMDRASEDSDLTITRNVEVGDSSKAANENGTAISDVYEESAKESSLVLASKNNASHILLPGHLDRMRAFRIGLTTDANVIPVTFLISEQQIIADFPEGEPSTVELYNMYATEIPEEELGFDDYHPYKGKLTLKDSIISHIVPEGHNYDLSPAALGVYEKSVDETFIDYDKFKTVDDNGELVNFGYVGLMEVKELYKGKRPLPYYKYVMPSGETYLTPDGGTYFATVEEALVAMKKAPNDMVEVLVPEQTNYEVRVADGVAIVSFKEILDLSQMNPTDALAMIEGFMLTAQNYHMVTKLENVQQSEFGNYNLTANLPEPVAVNPYYLTGN
ncbi:hypothetical protein [Sporosarcina sp. G11-34]|uniref:hypothetical protein n=1 Tax=Sporosarcina sp. G11-34 TaxID=2849605 RepID=UPI0022A8FC27|nr:hypothetical protein [Sporosarcina sp. G11-34]MCZ2259489.1 hypothetical protein [Sporosarcina sp. G11-34]